MSSLGIPSEAWERAAKYAAGNYGDAYTARGTLERGVKSLLESGALVLRGEAERLRNVADGWSASSRAQYERAVRAERALAVCKEALTHLTEWAEEVRGHYGIEVCGGPGKAATEWDEIQDGLLAAARDARSVLARLESEAGE